VRLSLEKIINNELIALNCSSLDEKCLIRNVGSGLPFDSVMISIFDTYGQKMVLEESLGFIEFAYKSDYHENNIFGMGEIPGLLNSTSERIILKGLKSIRSNQGVYNFSDVSKKFSISYQLPY